jgi:hypothetical protein
MNHITLLATAKTDIDSLHSDRSVPLRVTLESLSEVRDHLDVLIDAVECDLKADAG